MGTGAPIELFDLAQFQTARGGRICPASEWAIRDWGGRPFGESRAAIEQVSALCRTLPGLGELAHRGCATPPMRHWPVPLAVREFECLRVGHGSI